MNPADRKYTREHEWIKLENGSDGIVGITHYAQGQLGDVVYLDLPQIGARLVQFSKLGEVESVKAVSDLFSPISGEVLEINQDAIGQPEVVNEDPYGRGWLVRVQVQDPAELNALLTADQYQAYVGEISH